MSHSANIPAPYAPLEDHRDYSGSKIGMWLFLFTEVLLFGGLFILYVVYRNMYPGDFLYGSKNLNLLLGTVNTIVLLTSSLTMVLAITAAQKGSKGLAAFFLGFTIFCGFLFMAIKFNEWSAKIHHGIYPNSAELLKEEPGKIIFYGLYYSMTGLHALHVLIGMAILAYMFIPLFQRPFESTQWDVFRKPDLQGCSFSLKDKDGKEIWSSDKVDDSVKNMQVRFKYYPKEGRVKASDYVALENSGLYWHLVDLIWIFLFPLFYIIH